jgi:hypothetical protein
MKSIKTSAGRLSSIAVASLAVGIVGGAMPNALADQTNNSASQSSPGTVSPQTGATTERTPGSSSTGPSSNTSTGKNSASAGAQPVVILVPFAVATNVELEKGCWARLYDSTNYQGNMLTLAGPISIPRARPASVTGFELGRNYDSVAMGPKATMTVWDHENFSDKSATFKPGQKVPELDDRMGYFDEIKSVRLTCSN